MAYCAAARTLVSAISTNCVETFAGERCIVEIPGRVRRDDSRCGRHECPRHGYVELGAYDLVDMIASDA